ncbi:serine hydroxymethyltransferase [Loigolactobacillus rennini]|uniref:Serine hydroxymethyltransferase n=1 Tax=Loigolactobacillus rennini DSM 20253 TaxID=1423796 RepID=A0A0R2DCQ8_9LACO|nr:serine hydroxymethyltransferase [Loigolactobacillus rennini]KRM98598.1 glycine hydroxymethyltransferase [Loigolactobacillus rennini DSM 20253]
MDFQVRDPEVWQAIQREVKRQEQTIELIASESIVSDSVRAAQGSVLTNKYAEGYPKHRFYGGCTYIDQVEQLAIKRAKQLFDAEYANVQPHSGSNANMAVYAALLEPGDHVLGMNLADGGHLTHGAAISFSGQTYQFKGYGVDPKSSYIDYQQVRQLAHTFHPRLIVAGASAYSRRIDFKKFRQIADEVDAYLMVDMAHIAGLVAAGLHPNPVPEADVVTSTTHKTLRGPRGGLILAKEQYAKAINAAVFPGIQGGPLEHVIAAKAIAFKEAQQAMFKTYMRQVVKNAQAMAAIFNQEKRLKVISGGTDTHLLLVDVTGFDITGRTAQDLLDTVNITLNKNAIPEEQNGPFKTSGIRLGTPAMTTRGMKESQAEAIAKLIIQTLKHHEDPLALARIKQQVIEITKRFPINAKSFEIH